MFRSNFATGETCKRASICAEADGRGGDFSVQFWFLAPQGKGCFCCFFPLALEGVKKEQKPLLSLVLHFVTIFDPAKK